MEDKRLHIHHLEHTNALLGVLGAYTSASEHYADPPKKSLKATDALQGVLEAHLCR